jgi:hypothetical protein
MDRVKNKPNSYAGYFIGLLGKDREKRKGNGQDGKRE